jgi:hypothetical protein
LFALLVVDCGHGMQFRYQSRNMFL